MSIGRARMVSPRFRRGLIGVVGFLALVEVAVRASAANLEYVPPPSVVLARIGGLIVDTEFLYHVLITVWVWTLGLAIAVAIAVPLGVLLGSLPGVRTATRALVEFLRPIPPVAMIPLVIVLFGAGVQMKLVLVVYGAVWPILFNTVYALTDVDPVAKETARAFGYGQLAVLRKVSLPSAAPFIATGVRVSAAIALILTISAGLLAGGFSGLGIFIIHASSGAGNTDLVVATAALAGVLGFAGNSSLERGERRLFRWHFARSEEST